MAAARKRLVDSGMADTRIKAFCPDQVILLDEAPNARPDLTRSRRSRSSLSGGLRRSPKNRKRPRESQRSSPT